METPIRIRTRPGRHDADDRHAAEGHLIQQEQDEIDAERARQLRSKPAPAARRRRRAVNF